MIQRFRVFGESMSPALADGQYVVGEFLTYRFRNPKIGDMVVLKSPDSNINLIKRIIRTEPGGYFVEGDNKDQSRDSRNFGPVKINEILAKIIYL